MAETFAAYVVKQDEKGQVAGEFDTITADQLSAGEVLIQTAYSSVNYKDYLATQANTGIIREYPMIPGIDVSGEVIESSDSRFKRGDQVLVTGYGLGVNHTGGFAQQVRVPADWVIKLPVGLNMMEAMQVGTAGLTAGLAIRRLLRAGMDVNTQPNIIVTGAAGGVGSVAVQVLATMGFKKVTAIVRHPDQVTKLQQLGANEVILDSDFDAQPNKPLASQKYHFAIDTLGGEMAAHAITQLYYGGVIAMVGNASSSQLPVTVLPLILRGISILGIDSVKASFLDREQVWTLFATDWHIMPKMLTETVPFQALPKVIQQFKNHEHEGRTVIAFPMI